MVQVVLRFWIKAVVSSGYIDVVMEKKQAENYMQVFNKRGITPLPETFGEQNVNGPWVIKTSEIAAIQMFPMNPQEQQQTPFGGMYGRGGSGLN